MSASDTAATGRRGVLSLWGQSIRDAAIVGTVVGTDACGHFDGTGLFSGFL